MNNVYTFATYICTKQHIDKVNVATYMHGEYR